MVYKKGKKEEVDQERRLNSDEKKRGKRWIEGTFGCTALNKVVHKHKRCSAGLYLPNSDHFERMSTDRAKAQRNK
jgi:hypothetical protein